jgi:hypothetical protein
MEVQTKRNKRLYLAAVMRSGKIETNSPSYEHIIEHSMRPKESQRSLFFYNTVHYYEPSFGGRPRFIHKLELSQKQRQSVVILDFDFTGDEDDIEYFGFTAAVNAGVKRYETLTGHSALLVKSAGKGFHFVVPINTGTSFLMQDSFTQICHYILDTCFFDSKHWVCSTQKENKFPMNQGWYHSKAILEWAEKGVIYTQNKECKLGILFKECHEIKFAALRNTLSATKRVFSCLDEDEKSYYNNKINYAISSIMKRVCLRDCLRDDKSFQVNIKQILGVMLDSGIEYGMLWDDTNEKHITLRQAFKPSLLKELEEEEKARVEREDPFKYEEKQKQKLLKEKEKRDEVVAQILEDNNLDKNALNNTLVNSFIRQIFTEYGTPMRKESLEGSNTCLKNISALQAYIRLHPTDFYNGMESLVLFIITGVGYHKLMNGKEIGLGVKQFEKYFNTNHLIACILRKIIMHYLSVSQTTYVPKKKVTKYGIAFDKIKQFLKPKVAAAKRMAAYLGNGNTFTTMKKWIAGMFWDGMDMQEIMNIWTEALEISTANNKRQRVNDGRRFLEKLNSSWLYGQRGIYGTDLLSV